MLKRLWIQLFYIYLFFITSHLLSETRYISKTGSSIAPYTSWQTACDSLQKCFNYCASGDTIYIDRGIFRETIWVQNKNITIIGIDTDECIIDGTGVNGKYDKFTLCEFSNSSITVKNLTLKRKKLKNR